MYNESYEEYIRSILGYPNYPNNYSYSSTDFRNSQSNAELEACYPEIYKIVYPMVNKACSSNTRPITPELIDELTDEIYASIETDNPVNITINLTNEVSSSSGNRSVSNHTKPQNVSNKIEENRGENDRQFRNRGLQDLIRILLIRELLGRPGGFPGNRPPMRPPFPGGPGGGRPPIMPRSNRYQDIYE